MKQRPNPIARALRSPHLRQKAHSERRRPEPDPDPVEQLELFDEEDYLTINAIIGKPKRS